MKVLTRDRRKRSFVTEYNLIPELTCQTWIIKPFKLRFVTLLALPWARQIFMVRIFVGRVHHLLPAQLRVMRSVAPVSRTQCKKEKKYVFFFVVKLFNYHKISLILVLEFQDLLNSNWNTNGSGRRTVYPGCTVNFNLGSIQTDGPGVGDVNLKSLPPYWLKLHHVTYRCFGSYEVTAIDLSPKQKYLK